MDDPPRARGPHAVALGLFLLVWLSIVWFGSFEWNPNTSTRLFAAISLVEQGDATIDEFAVLTIDKAHFGAHFYTDKAPGMTLMAVPAVWIADLVTGDRATTMSKILFDPRLEPYLRLRLRLAVATSVAVLVAFAAVLLLDLATGVTGSARAGLVAAIGYALATPAWGWSTTLFGHASVGALLLIACWAVWRGTSGARELARWRYPVLLGLSLGWAIVVELPAALPAAAIGLYAIWRTRGVAPHRRLWLAGTAALVGCIALTPMFIYNALAFGTPFRVGYEGVVGFDGMQRGLFGLTYPHLDVLAQIIAGPRRGLVFVAPLVLVAPFGLFRLIRDPVHRDLGWLVAGIITIVLLYNASYYYWDGGYSTGPRHAVPALGFLALGLAPLWSKRGKVARGCVAAALVLGMGLNLAIAAAEVTAPDTASFPVYDPILTHFFAGMVRTLPGALWGWQPGFAVALYLVLALPLLWFLHRAASLSDAARPALERDRITLMRIRS